MCKLKTEAESAFPLQGQQFLTLSASLQCRRIPKVSGQKTLPCWRPGVDEVTRSCPGEGRTAACSPNLLLQQLPQAQAYLVSVLITYLLLGVLPAFPSLCPKIQGLSLSTCYVVDVPKVRHWLEFREWDGGRNQGFLPPVSDKHSLPSGRRVFLVDLAATRLPWDLIRSHSFSVVIMTSRGFQFQLLLYELFINYSVNCFSCSPLALEQVSWTKSPLTETLVISSVPSNTQDKFTTGEKRLNVYLFVNSEKNLYCLWQDIHPLRRCVSS